MTNAQVSVDIDYLIRTAREAGEAILEIYETDFDVARKDDRSPITQADLYAHQIITQRLREKYPDIPVLSEENLEQTPYETRKGWKRLWLVDPLDGTKEFIKKNGQFTVNIGLIEDSQPAVGVVYAPALDLLYYADREGGAFKSDKGSPAEKLAPSPSPNAGKLVIAGSLSHPVPEMDAFVADQRRKYKDVEFIAMGSSLKLCLVADGRADVYPRFGPTMEWDTAAAHAVANGAGRKVLRHGSGEQLAYNKEDLHNPWFIVQ